MAVSTPVPQKDKYQVLRQACARNASAKLHFEDPETGLITARVRLLDMDAERIYMDRPQSVGRRVDLKPKQAVAAYFLLNGTRYAFRSRIARPDCYVRLNQTQQVPGTAVTLPAQVGRQQRRAEFRISLVGYEDLEVAVHGGSADNGGAAPVDSVRWAGRLLNVSAGGVGALFKTDPKPRWRPGQLFFLAFGLPGVETTFLTLAELGYLRRIDEGQPTIAGFRFRPWPMVPMESYRRQITRFIAVEQRRQLRRGRQQ
jgi:c-di-GMP-binding flagellar brake protein YcgR